jgi:hypothetical protein
MWRSFMGEENEEKMAKDGENYRKKTDVEFSMENWNEDDSIGQDDEKLSRG